MIYISLLFTLFVSFMPSLALALDEEPLHGKGVRPQALTQIDVIVEEITKNRTRLVELEAKLANSSASKSEAIKQEIQVVTGEIERDLNALEQISTGSADLSLFEEQEEEDFSWNEEVREVFRPVLVELKRISERPRQIEKLRTEIEMVAGRHLVAQEAVHEISKLLAVVEDGQKRELLEDLLAQWQNVERRLQTRLQLIKFKLDEKLSSDDNQSSVFLGAIKGFVTGRGVNILLALTVAFSMFGLLRLAGVYISKRVQRGQDKESRFHAKVFQVIFQVFTFVLSIMALMVTLYALGDWLLLTIVLIIGVGLMLALRTSVPRYIGEARLLLNLGSVREGERVVYNGLPWRVSRLNVYSDLVNPALTGGRIRLHITDMLDLVSRRWARKEPWFPCKTEEFVILDDDTYGKVVLQTPEIVQLDVLGSSLKTYPVIEFLAKNPRNLSEGFGLFVTFGLDYDLQSEVEDIPPKLESYLKAALKNSAHKDHLKLLAVDFKQAAASALEVIIIAKFEGDAAASYFALGRLLNRLAVSACNEYAWGIPFDQLTVHLES